jgi:nucleoside-diphosphate-sugar epimerase
VLGDARGPFNVATEPPLDVDRLATLLRARAVSVPLPLVRGFVATTWRLRLQPTPPGWIDLALGAPLMDCSRAERELGWQPERGADDALLELLGGLRNGTGAPTPPLYPDASRAAAAAAPRA